MNAIQSGITMAIGLTAFPLQLVPGQATKGEPIGTLDGGARLIAFQTDSGQGLAVIDAGAASVTQSRPVQLEFYGEQGEIEQKSAAYQSLRRSGVKAEGTATLAGPAGSQFTVTDTWTVRGAVIELVRTVRVSGTSSSSFLSSITFSHPQLYERSAVDYFAPGMIYGGTSHLSPASIGGPMVYQPTGQGHVRIREDRLPAPLFGLHFGDGSSLSLLDPVPNGETTTADSLDTEVHAMSDERFRFGAIGADLDGGHHTQGYWFPGSEGEVTYRGNTYPGGQVHEWRRRYHPIRNGFVQQYRVHFRFSRAEEFPAYVKSTWRWAYATLQPALKWQDIPTVKKSIIDVLSTQVQTKADRAGIPNIVPATAISGREPNRQAIMGFTGKNLEAAEFLLADAQLDSDNGRAANNRKLGLAIFASFIRLRMNPPVGEGFNLDTGDSALAIPRNHCVYLRSFGDDMKATLRAYRREQRAGINHREWLRWAQQFGDWLLTQQMVEGGFPRSWKPVSGEVLDASPQSSYNPIPFLVLLSDETKDPRYLHSAERAADLVWNHGQAQAAFVGGTIDNPDVLDKEAGTLSIEAYIALYEATHDSKWLMRAHAAAEFAETWIYLWNVPMPLDADSSIQWKRGVPTAGTQLIASGHSLVDDYMSFDVDEYAKLGTWTHDDHDLEIAKLLLHNTKNMIALPGRVYDLKGPGWQQEHYSFAPIRGYGLHRLWLPWVATSQLNGIFELEEFDPLLFRKWTESKEEQHN